MDVLQRNNVRVFGQGERPMVFAHGFGCDQHMWRMLTPAFESTHRIVLFDHVGAGKSDLSQYVPSKYAALSGYAHDMLEICETLGVRGGVFVGHSVSAMIGVLASIASPATFDRLVLVGPSPRYLDDEGYVGGFSHKDIEGLLETLDGNYLGWSRAMAPVIMGNSDRPDLGEELTNSFCRTDPTIAKQFARVTFLSDNRADLPRVRAATLILQCSSDVIAPLAVGEYLHRNIAGSELHVLRATGHCPHLSAPEETIASMRSFVQ